MKTLCFSFFVSSFVYPQFRIDTIFSDPISDGEIAFFVKYNSLIVNSTEGSFTVGDGISAVGYGKNITKGYLSFSLNPLWKNFSIDTAKILIYQMGSVGDSKINSYPKWNVQNGDTMYCIVDHVDYGDLLDTLDWFLDSLNKVYSYNIGIMSNDSIKGFKQLNVTKYVQTDIDSQRSSSQFRLRFPIDTDDDELDDAIQFASSNRTPNIYNPRLIIISNITSAKTNDPKILHSFNLYQNYPNPFNSSTKIIFDIGHSSNVLIEVFNSLGQKIKTIVDNYYNSGSYGINISLDSYSSGVYFIKMTALSFTKSISLIHIK